MFSSGQRIRSPWVRAHGPATGSFGRRDSPAGQPSPWPHASTGLEYLKQSPTRILWGKEAVFGLTRTDSAGYQIFFLMNIALME